MYKMLIVDDEPLIVQGMCRAIARLELFETEAAASGLEALEQIGKGGVDCMMLDINMPDMNGLELMRQLSERGQSIPTVIISGYEAFDYAKQAMQYGAFDYVLKPVSPMDVASIGLKIFERLETMKREERSNEELRSFVMEQRGVIKQRLLSDILGASVRRERLTEIRRLYGLDLRGDYYTAVVIHIRKLSEKMDEMGFQMALRRAEKEIERSFENVPEANLFNMENAHYVLLMSASCPFDLPLLEQLLEQTAEALSNIEGVEAFIGKGGEVQGLEQVRYSYRSANDALDYQAMFKNDRVYDIGDFRKDKAVEDIENLIDRIEEELRHMRYDLVEELVNRLFDCLGAQGGRYSEAQILFFGYQCSCALLKVMLENGLTTMDESIKELLLPGMRPGESTEQMRTRTLAMLHVLRKEMIRAYSEQNRSISHKVAEYIRGHYEDSKLSVNGISAELNYSANYLGNAFKREYGEGINDYLSKYRVEMARKLMDETDMMVYEIAFAVGFNDQHYFSKTFKKLTNMSPSEYRSSGAPRHP